MEAEIRRRLESEYATSSGSSAAPKYLVKAQAAMNIAASANCQCWPESSASSQKTSASIQSASIRMSHMTVVLETKKPGLNNVASAASKGQRVMRPAKR